jgi:hypothetical protein
VAWLKNPEWVTSQIVPGPVLTHDMHWQSATGRHNIRVASNVDRDPIFNDIFLSAVTPRGTGTVVAPQRNHPDSATRNR